MKKMLVIFCLSACTVQRTDSSNYLLIAEKPTTASKETLIMVINPLYYDVASPKNIVILKQNIYTKIGWRTALVLYYQVSVGDFWQILEVFPQEGKYPQIQKIEQPKQDSLVVRLLLCNELSVTRSYVQINGTWTPL